MKKVLVVSAVCNEAASLKVFLPKLRKIVSGLGCKIEVLVVDDGSTDNTVQVARSAGCKVTSNNVNRGIGYSLRKGYLWAKNNDYDYIFTIDGDGQHDPTLLETMLWYLTQHKTDFIVASRYHKDSERRGVPIDRDMLNLAVTAQMRVVTGWKLTDPLSGFWGMNRRCYELSLEYGNEERYGIHLENLILFWYLSVPRLRHMELAHPAIYQRQNGEQLLTRQYSESNKEQRVERFGTHALHVLNVLNRVRTDHSNGVLKEIEKRRKELK